MASSISTASIIIDAEAYVVQLLSEKLTVHHKYHHLNHTLDVRSAANTLAAMAGLSPEDQELLELAALFHDTGFVDTYEEHEAKSGAIAEQFLAERGYPQDKIQVIRSAIDATKPGVVPDFFLAELLCDADLSHLARPDYEEISNGLRYEWKFFRNSKMKKREWREENVKFLKAHSYYTQVAQGVYGTGKAENLASLQAKTKKKKKKKGSGSNGITGSRTAQMMFKTASRNHIDLAALADNKANIMLSVSTLIVTVVVPWSIRQMTSGDFYLVPPVLALVITSMVSMVFATLATRPIKMRGNTSKEEIKSGKSNLFFFGNFYNMEFSRFDEGIEEVINDDEALESSIKRDLYYLGKSLGKKYSQLRICYTVFMFGIIGTVLLFAFSYIMLKGVNPPPFLDHLLFDR